MYAFVLSTSVLSVVISDRDLGPGCKALPTRGGALGSLEEFAFQLFPEMH